MTGVRGWFEPVVPLPDDDTGRPAPAGPPAPVPPAPAAPPAASPPAAAGPDTGGSQTRVIPVVRTVNGATVPAISAKNGTGRPSVDQYGTGSVDATTLLPPVVPDDRTAVLPRLRDQPSEFARELAGTPAGTPPADGRRAARRAAPRGVQVIPLRPVRTEDGYKSVYSEVTRTTPATVLRTAARGAGEVLITLGLVVLLFAAYEVWGKAAIVGAQQNDLDRQLAQEWAQEPSPAPSAGPQAGLGQAAPPPPSGNALARMYIPRMNKYWVVVQGVRPADIRYAPGHYPETAMPGQVGNFAVAGHRMPSVFWDLDKVQVGDAVVVETAQTFYVYKVTQSHVVLPTAVQVVAPVPGQPAAKASKAMLTITTCNPKYNNYQRLIVHAELTTTQPRSAGRPAEIGG